jgi:hypothetical protein
VTLETHAREAFAVDAQTYWRELCLSLEYQERMYREALGCTRMEVLELKGSYETGQTRRLRFEKPIDAPAAIRKLFGEVVTIEEISEFDPKLARWSYRMVPPVLSDRLELGGAIRLEETTTGVEHISVSTVTCSVFGIGSVIERFVGKSAVEGTADKIAFTRRYIAERGLCYAPDALAPALSTTRRSSL